MPSEERSRKDRRIERKITIKAKRRVRSKVGFMWHFAVFVMVNLTIVAINLNYTPKTLWFFWPLAGWGAGLLLHGFATAMGTGASSDMVAREIEIEKQRRGLVG
jgi:hypothetical protein